MNRSLFVSQFILNVGIFHLRGELILPHLLCYDTIAVEKPQLHVPMPRICSNLNS